MENRPNIFDYAKKELSQDAMICWFLACVNSTDSFYKNIGVEFVKFILGNKKVYTESYRIYDDAVWPQFKRMDVFAVLCNGNKATPLIFEDKTDTYLHSNQIKYPEKFFKWKNEKYKDGKPYLEYINEKYSGNLTWAIPKFIYFKTGYVPEWQIHDFKKNTMNIQNADFREIYIDNIIGFLEDLTKTLSKEFPNRKETLIEDYIEHLLKKKEENETSDFAKWDKRLTKIFERSVKTESMNQGWVAYYILTFNNDIIYSLRCGYYGHGDAICFQQFRDDKKWERTEQEIDERKENAQMARDICEKIIPELKIKHSIELKMENNDGSSQNTLFRVPISKENESNVCEFFKEFIGEFVDRVKTDTELSRELDEVFYERTDIL